MLAARARRLRRGCASAARGQGRCRKPCRPPGCYHKRAATFADGSEGLFTGNDHENLVVVPSAMRLLRFLDLDQVDVVYHSSVATDEAAIGEEIMDRHVAHLGDDGVRLVTAERVNRFETMRHR